MAFFEKVGNFAKGVADKTGDSIEIGKLNGEIKSQENKIAASKADLGEYIWNQFQKGAELDAPVVEICKLIQEEYDRITELEGQIEEIKEKQQQRAQERAAASAAAGTIACAKCGARLEKDARFCPECGTKVEVPEAPEAPTPERPKFCHQCGAELDADSRFCGACGAKVE